MATAERIKTFYGGVVATGMDDREMIEIGGDTGDWERDRRTVSRAELIGIMRPRVEEILEEVRARLDAAGFEHLPSQQIVLTGGASQIPGLDGLAPRILGQQVRLGRPLRVQGLPQAATGRPSPARWACACSPRIRRTNGGTSRYPPDRYRRARLRGRDKMVQGQLVTPTSGGSGEMPLRGAANHAESRRPTDFVAESRFFSDLGRGSLAGESSASGGGAPKKAGGRAETGGQIMT
jgi:cell division ATPase FtsA